MVNICPECGEKFIVLYPQLWVYKREMLLCSWHCLRKHDKEKENMRMKKDGTPAKRPGPNKKENVISAVDIIEAIGAETQEEPEKNEPLEVLAVKSKAISGVVYRREKEYMAIEYSSIVANPLAFEHMRRQDWVAFCKEVMIALDQLGVVEE